MHGVLHDFQPNGLKRSLRIKCRVPERDPTVTNFSRVSTSFHYRPSVNERELTDMKKLAMGSV